MARAAEKFEIKDADRSSGQALIIGMEGPPGGGKTFSSLKMATGIQRVRGGPIIVVDSDNERAAAYADYFDFKHLILRPPFRSLRYLDAVRAANALKPAAIIVDSMSDEHEGEGGILDYQRDEVDRIAGQGANWDRKQACNQAGWIKPKAERLAMINGFLQLEGKTPIILCFRARQKTKPVENDKGKVVPTNIGWQPIAPAEITGNCTTLCLLPPGSDGTPKWKTGIGEEDFVLKLPVFARSIFEEPGSLNEGHGEALAKWASGKDRAKVSPGAKGKSAGASDGAKGAGAPPADTEPSDDFPGDDKPFVFTITNRKDETKTTKDGQAWADQLVKWIEGFNDDGAAKIWSINKAHVEAAEAKGQTIPAQRVWVAAKKRGLTE